jgi:hypothetical protein
MLKSSTKPTKHPCIPLLRKIPGKGGTMKYYPVIDLILIRKWSTAYRQRRALNVLAAYVNYFIADSQMFSGR